MKRDLEMLRKDVAAFACVRPTPLVGTPAASIHEGNSAPARTLVAGFSKSERTGERWEAK